MEINININIKRITQKPGKRGGRPCIQGLRISVSNVLSLLSSGMSHEEILHDFSELEAENILAVRLLRQTVSTGFLAGGLDEIAA